MRFKISDFVKETGGKFFSSEKLIKRFPGKNPKEIAREMSELGFENVRSLINGKRIRGFKRKEKKVKIKGKMQKGRRATVKCFICDWSGYIFLEEGWHFRKGEPSIISKEGEEDKFLYCPRPECHNRIYKWAGKRETEEEALTSLPGRY